jgi:hypothetical protein
MPYHKEWQVQSITNKASMIFPFDLEEQILTLNWLEYSTYKTYGTLLLPEVLLTVFISDPSTTATFFYVTLHRCFHQLRKAQDIFNPCCTQQST